MCVLCIQESRGNFESHINISPNEPQRAISFAASHLRVAVQLHAPFVVLTRMKCAIAARTPAYSVSFTLRRLQGCIENADVGYMYPFVVS